MIFFSTGKERRTYKSLCAQHNLHLHAVGLTWVFFSSLLFIFFQNKFSFPFCFFFFSLLTFAMQYNNIDVSLVTFASNKILCISCDGELNCVSNAANHELLSGFFYLSWDISNVFQQVQHNFMREYPQKLAKEEKKRFFHFSFFLLLNVHEHV